MLELYTESRNLFEKYAGFAGDTSELKGLEGILHGYQIELARWQHRNFSKTQMGDCQFALGIAEEVGELCEAIDHADRKDARGDIAIFMAQLLTLNRMSIAPIIEAAHGKLVGNEFKRRADHSVAECVGKICHVVLKRHQMIRGMEEDAAYRASLFVWCAMLLRSANCLVDDFIQTSRVVLKRDWTKQ